MSAPTERRPIAEDLTLRNTDDCLRTGILCERPTDTRQPLDAGALWYAMAAGVAIVIGMAIWTWLERKADRGSGGASGDHSG